MVGGAQTHGSRPIGGGLSEAEDPMADLTYERVDRELRARALRYTFARGRGGPLLVLWLLGAGAFMTALDAPLFAAAWTAASAVFGGLIARDDQKNPGVRQVLSRPFLDGHFPVDKLSDPAHRRPASAC